MNRRLLLLGALFLFGSGGCGDDDSSGSSSTTPPRCIELPSAACTPLYTPTFNRVFTETLQRTCAQTRACHSADGRQGGLAFNDLNESYQLLLGANGGKARVVPGDPACSELIVRTHSLGKAWQMPPGANLSEGELCALRTWVAQGAQPPSQ